MQRSEFLKLSCAGCMLTAAGITGAAFLMQGCSPKTGSIITSTVRNKELSIPLSAIAADKITIVRGKGLEYDIALRPTGKEEAYEALLLRCTHFSNPLVVNGDHFDCSLHGSRFSADGAVQKGPASQPLQKLPCVRSGNNLIIHV